MQLKLTKQQQQQFAQKLNDALERVTMSWDKDLRRWHSIALSSLNFASALSLNIPQNKFIDLFNQENQGLNMNVVMALCNNIEGRTPQEMEVTPKDWAETLLLNHSIAQRWQQMVTPIQNKVAKEFEIMVNRPQLVVAQA